MKEKATLSLSAVTRAKGLFCILVLLHHINQVITVFDGTVIDLIFNQFGYISVAAFLFFSGYGLTAQAQKRPEYVKSMWKTRILSTYAIYLVIAAIYFAAVMLTGTSLSYDTAIRTFLFGGTVVRNGWYFQCQLFMYVLYFLAFRFTRRVGVRTLLLSLFTLSYILLCLALGLEEMWYQSVPCFFLGVLWKILEEKIGNFAGGGVHLSLPCSRSSCSLRAQSFPSSHRSSAFFLKCFPRSPLCAQRQFSFA